MPDESKLPRWIQNELSRLRMEVKRLEGENEVLRGKQAKSNTALLALGKVAYDEIWLPDHSTVRFYLEGSETFGSQFCVDVQVRRDYPKQLQLMGHSSISIYPHASNVVMVEAAR